MHYKFQQFHWQGDDHSGAVFQSGQQYPDSLALMPFGSIHQQKQDGTTHLSRRDGRFTRLLMLLVALQWYHTIWHQSITYKHC